MWVVVACLCYCLAEALFLSREGYQVVRKMLVQYIRKHQEFYEPFFTSTRDFNGYCARMLEDVLGDYLMIFAASKHFKACIIVVESLPSLDVLYVGEEVCMHVPLFNTV